MFYSNINNKEKWRTKIKRFENNEVLKYELIENNGILKFKELRVIGTIDKEYRTNSLKLLKYNNDDTHFKIS